MPSSNIAGMTEIVAADVAAGDLAYVYDLTGPSDKKIQAQNLLDALMRVAASGNGTFRRVSAGWTWTSANGLAMVFNDDTVTPSLVVGGSNGVIGVATVRSPSDQGSITKATAQGVWRITGNLGTGGGTLCSPPLTPAQITSNQNDYAPGAAARFFRLSTDASRTITGLSVSQEDGRECEVWNAGSFNLVLAHESASSTAANRFVSQAGSNITLAPGSSVSLRYDGTASRWRITSTGAVNLYYESGDGQVRIGPALSVRNAADTGFGSLVAAGITATEFVAAGNIEMSATLFRGDQLGLGSGTKVGWAAGASGAATLDAFLKRGGTRVIRLGDGTDGHTLASAPYTAAQITADQDNYALPAARYYRLSSDASRTITGMNVAQTDGQEFEIWNVGSNNIILADQSLASTAGYRFLSSTGANITLGPNEIALCRYDGASSRIRVWKV